MTRPLILSLALLASSASLGCAVARADSPSTAASTQLSQQSSVDDVLDALDARGKDLSALSADVAKSERDESLGEDTETRIGKVVYQRLPDGATRIRATFDQVKIGDRTRDDRVEYLLDNGVLIDRTYRSKVEARRIVHRPGQKLNLFKLGEGPFPLPIGQSKANVHAEFEVTQLPPADSDPPNTLHVSLVPKPETQLSRRFKAIEVWVDLADHMPRRIETLDSRGTTRTRTDLSNVRLNEPLTDDRFALEKIDPNQWQITEEGMD